ncbi:expressed protein [Chlorella variabilis]|uniref:Expressed protein n=1 Tax=Chlorella variabilis TaxID=554065 RepID=E1Z253_CHLVA|nr:expressed protein [Chlorella variabilis]EFN59939.1 expressed protein [Chlorella variabilis]|eukprot:XP_005852041.1 expressed protein [Chlorella variabilis]
MTSPRALALALCLTLAAAGSAAAPHPIFSCADLPAKWGSDPSEKFWSEVTPASPPRYASDPSATRPPGCSNWTPDAYGCQQTAGRGTNYALQVNFTCTSPESELTLGMTVDVNTYEQYINVDDLDVEFLAVNGDIVMGNLDEHEWYDANDSIWGDVHHHDDHDDDDDDDDDFNNASSSYWQNVGAGFAAAGKAAGEKAAAAGEAIGQSFENMFGRKLK